MKLVMQEVQDRFDETNAMNSIVAVDNLIISMSIHIVNTDSYVTLLRHACVNLNHY